MADKLGKYYIGLDLGTDSVGWAVTDERYRLLRRKGKDLWGARLFSSAKTSQERRSNRTNRRRLQRRKQRLNYLQESFREEIEKIDPGFLQRLADSKYLSEDKTIDQPYALFADKGYTDVEFHKEYPTIYHLRAELMKSKEPHDVRLVYLALHSLFKYRGHFLNQGLKEGEMGNIVDIISHIKELYDNLFEEEFQLAIDEDAIENILCDHSLSGRDRHNKILDNNDISKRQKRLIECWKLICGLKAKISVIFGDVDSIPDDQVKLSVSFKDGNFEENKMQIQEMLSEESFDFFTALQSLHDYGVLATLMKGNGRTYSYLSFAKVDQYNKHRDDLKVLKEVYRKLLPDQYNEMFRIMEKDNYSAYVGSVNSNEQIVRRGAKDEDFFGKLKSQLTSNEEIKADSRVQYILGEIERGTFLPKQRGIDNGVVPYQILKAEVRKILENAENYLPFLLVKDDGGRTLSERLLEMFSFRIPYFVGPLRTTQGSKGWVVRNEGGTIYPWNIDQKVDMEKTREKFIDNLIRQCTYLADEKVMPKNSLLYEKFMVLNELNNLCVNESRISVSLKQDIYKDLFQRSGKRVTVKKLLDYLKMRGVVNKDDTADCLSGFDKASGGFINTLANYHKFAEALKTDVLTDNQIKMAEDIIYYSTIYGESKAFLKALIDKKYGNILSNQEMKRILGLKFKDWGRLSKAFLETEGADCETGEIITIIHRMWENNLNLMQLFDKNKFTYQEELEKKKKQLEKNIRQVTYEDLDGYYFSAPVRRMVWQTIRVVKEIEKVMKSEPTRIFVEVTRSEGNKGDRKDSRKKALIELYKNCNKDEKYLAEEVSEHSEQDFRAKKLYLYYRQKGRCMYSGESIALEDLFNENKYDIDHIYPRHFVKDDSIENNLVLVKSELNRGKTDEYPINSDIQKRCHSLWKSLHDNRFINDEKYYRLTRKTPFTDDDLSGFINRQLVETGQGTKAVASLLTEIFGGVANDRVIYVKAGNVSEFRKKIEFFKCRCLNDFHHAHDAYLNIVVGNVYLTKFTRNPVNFVKEYRSNGSKYHLGRMFDFPVKRGSIDAWEPDRDFPTVRKMLQKNTPLITMRSYEAHGSIAHQTLYSKTKAGEAKPGTYIPLKAKDQAMQDVGKYGGYRSVNGAYFFLVEHTIKKKRVRTIETMPIMAADKYSTKEKKEEYCKNKLGYKDPVVLVNKIPMYSVIRVDGFDYYLSGRTNDRLIIINAIQLCLSPEKAKYIRDINKVLDRDYSDEDMIHLCDKGLTINRNANMILYRELLDKHKSGKYQYRKNPVGEKLEKALEKFEQLSLKDQCYILGQIITLSQRSNTGADLELIGYRPNTGKTLMSKDITKCKEVLIIQKSITGIYEKKIDLLSL